MGLALPVLVPQLLIQAKQPYLHIIQLITSAQATLQLNTAEFSHGVT